MPVNFGLVMKYNDVTLQLTGNFISNISVLYGLNLNDSLTLADERIKSVYLIDMQGLVHHLITSVESLQTVVFSGPLVLSTTSPLNKHEQQMSNSIFNN